MRLALIPRLALEQRPSLFQAQMLEVPVASLDALISDIYRNPASFEWQLAENKNPNHGSNVKSMFPGFFPPRGKGNRGGFIASPPLIVLPEDKAVEELDGIYYSKGDNKPEFKPGKNLEPHAPAAEMINAGIADYKLANRLIANLIKERNWMVLRLRDMYSCLGESQIEYITTLDKTKLNPLMSEKLIDIRFSEHPENQTNNSRFS